MSDNIDSYIEQCLSLSAEISDMASQPIASISAYDMSIMRKKGLDLSVLAMRVQMDMASMRYDYDLEQWDVFDTLANKMKKPVTMAREAGKIQADKKFWRYRVLDDLLKWVDRVLKQVEGFAVQWNVMQRETWNYINSGMKDMS